MVTFQAEILKVEVKKTLSMDKEYRIVMVTDSANSLELAKWVNEKTVKITVDPQEK
jgi:hypothetical protein